MQKKEKKDNGISMSCELVGIKNLKSTHNWRIEFDVYEIDDVWPYNLILGTDTDVIALDGGATSANISARLLNKIGNPIRNAQINYESTLGSIIATGFTDSLGADTVVFSDLGNPDDVGVSDIKSTFSHPGFDQEYIQDSLQVFANHRTQHC